MKTLGEKIAIMNAFIEGKTIQTKLNRKGKWRDDSSPKWDWSCYDYRIKPEAEYRPYNHEELLGEILKNRLFVKRKGQNEVLVITSDTTAGITVYNKFYSFSRALEELEWYDGSPFGVKIEEDSNIEYVDLGLSVLWATCNVGASKPEEYGKYFKWGDVKGQTWEEEKWSGKGFEEYQPYELDANNKLKPEYDAAHVNLGGKWRMPTKAEFQELINNCDYVWTTIVGVYGRLFTSKKAGYTDKSIFLPAAGYGYVTTRNRVGSYGYYWSSSFNSGDYEWSLYFDSDNVYTTSYRYIGFPVRGVKSK